jgi:hypothetical protein
MNGLATTQIEGFAVAARNFCTWATSAVLQDEHQAGLAAQYLSALFAAGCAFGWDEGEPGDFRRPATQGVEAVRAKASALQFRYYSEIFNNLVIPPEEPVVGDIVDDLVDIYSDVAPGLALFESGDQGGARNHWQFWFSRHWGEHATSALRALWSYLSEREGHELSRASQKGSLEQTPEK